MKTIRHRRLVIALIVMLVGVLVGLAWLVWPEPSPKNLKLRLKFLRTELVDGKTKVLFEVQGAERYEIHLVAFIYFYRNDGFSVSHVFKNRIVYTEPPQHYPEAPQHWTEASFLNDQGWKVRADLEIILHKSKFFKLPRVIKDTWEFRHSGGSLFSIAKEFWRGVDSRQVIDVYASDVITNASAIQSAPEH